MFDRRRWFVALAGALMSWGTWLGCRLPVPAAETASMGPVTDVEDRGDRTTPAGGEGTPTFYFVLHADPATGPGLQQRWQRLVRFMGDLAARNASLARPHHVTVMFTPEWGKLLADPANGALRDRVRSWIEAGHQFAFHSHTHNHIRRDGYTNAPQFGDDFGPEPDLCTGDRAAGECTLDHGYRLVADALQQAVPGYGITFAAIGPRGNGGLSLRWGANDNSCDPELDAAGNPLTDETGCIDAEWSVTLDTSIPYVSMGYAGDEPLGAAELLTTSTCVRYAVSVTDIYALRHAPFETESGQPQATLAAVRDALNMGGEGDYIGVVIHPSSYEGANVDTVQALFDFLDDRDASYDNRHGPIASVTLDEARDADVTGSGVACKSFR